MSDMLNEANVWSEKRSHFDKNVSNQLYGYSNVVVQIVGSLQATKVLQHARSDDANDPPIHGFIVRVSRSLRAGTVFSKPVQSWELFPSSDSRARGA